MDDGGAFESSIRNLSPSLNYKLQGGDDDDDDVIQEPYGMSIRAN
jgi:hypothetical protein